MTRYLAMIYLLLYIMVAVYLARKPDPQEQPPFSFPSLTTNYLQKAP